ncbi:MAG TPA: AsmA-like C-terminal region-containing protein [Longimicrobiales bacterium]|nr:AsmA-like C-terminal region-containing protein [Longimicrobiales bacterium]
MRRSILIALAIIASCAVVLAAAVLLLPAERVGAFAAAQASAALGRDVEVERFGVRLFPRPAVALENVRVGRSTRPDSTLASAERVELRPRLLPLLRRRIVIDEIVLQRPFLHIDVTAGETGDLTARSDSAPAGSGTAAAELDIRRVRITDGTAIYRDTANATAVSLTGITQTLKLSGSVTGGALTRVAASGELAIADMDISAPSVIAWPLRDLRLHVAHDVLIDRDADRVAVDELTVTLQELALDVTGTVTAMTDSLERRLDLRAQTGSVDVAKLIASLPQALLESSGGDVLTGADGFARLDVAVNGRAGAGAIPDVAGVLTLEDAALARGRHGTIASGLNGSVAFSLDSLSSGGITGSVLGEPVRVALSVHDLAAPTGRVSIQAALALAEARKLGLMPDSVQGSGRVAVDITANGSLVEPAEAVLSGSVDLTGVQLDVASLRQPVLVQQGRISLDGRMAAAEDLRATIGQSDVALDFAATEWLPYVLGDTLRAPTITFDARSASFDADEIFGVEPDTYTYGELFFARLADRAIDGKTAAQAAEEVGLGMPEVPPMTMDGRIRATRFVRGAVPFNDVDITIAARAREVDVRAASFRMMGGGIHMTGRLGLAGGNATAGSTQPLALDYTINDVAAGQFLERFTTFRDHLTGDLLVAGSMSMVLDEHLLPVRESVSGAGTAAIIDGEIVNWPLLRALGDRIGVAQFDTLAFSDWSGRYRVAGPKVVLEESMLQSGELGVRAAGSFDLNGSLDLGATLYMPPQWTARVPGAPAAFLTSAAAGDDGRVPIGARFTGSARDPSVSLDMSEAGTRIANAAREAAEREAREAAERAAGQVADRIADRLPPRDSMTAAADSAKKKVEAEVVNRLRRIIKPGGN